MTRSGPIEWCHVAAGVELLLADRSSHCPGRCVVVIGKRVRPSRSSVGARRRSTAVGRPGRGIWPDNDRPVEVGGFRLDPRPRPEG